MSNVALDLDEHAAELGFADHLEAMANGYDWAVKDDGTAYLFKRKDPQEEAHAAWLKEKEEVLAGLESCLETSECSPACDIDIKRAIEFIKRGEV